MFKQNNLWKY